MPKSIATAVAPQNNKPTTTQATFKAGDTVLCPHWGMDSYTVQESGVKDFPLAICGQFAPDYENSYFCFDENGINTLLQAVFHDTPANRQAIATLYHGEPTPQANQPKTINLARPNDDEVIIMGAFEVSNLACEFSGIADTLHDISILLSMIYRDEITHTQAKAMARAIQYTAEVWENGSLENINRLNVALKQTSFGEVTA